MKAHGGEIWVESTEGVGSLFTFTLLSARTTKQSLDIGDASSLSETLPGLAGRWDSHVSVPPALRGGVGAALVWRSLDAGVAPGAVRCAWLLLLTRLAAHVWVMMHRF